MQAPAPDRRLLWLGTPGADDSKRSADEVRIIREMTAQEVDVFLGVNNIDQAAAKELRNEQPHVQLAVLERGPLRACVNPSGALVARIRDAKRGILTGSGSRYGSAPAPATLDANASELDKFLVENRIDQAGVASFRSETMEVQKAVMARGPLVNTTNPSASLMARIRTVKQDLANGGTGMPASGPMANVGLSDLMTGGGVRPQPVAPRPALALEAPGPSLNPAPAFTAGGAPGLSFDFGAEAMKAIQKMASQPQEAAAAQEPAPMEVTPAATPRAENPDMNNEDKRLQDEALRAIMALNSAGVGN